MEAVHLTSARLRDPQRLRTSATLRLCNFRYELGVYSSRRRDNTNLIGQFLARTYKTRIPPLAPAADAHHWRVL